MPKRASPDSWRRRRSYWCTTPSKTSDAGKHNCARSPTIWKTSRSAPSTRPSENCHRTRSPTKGEGAAVSSATPRKDPSNGSWWFIVELPPKPDGSRRQVKRRGFRTKAEAQAALDEVRVTARQGTYVAPARQTFKDFLVNEWLPTAKRELAESTWESYVRNIRHHVVPHIGSVQLQVLDGGTLNTLYSELLVSGRVRGQQSKGLKPRTVRYIHTIIHAALDD